MTRWQLQEAEQKFRELVRRAHDAGPQVVARHGEDVAVVIDIEEYRRLTHNIPDFKTFLLTAPNLDELDLSRSRVPAPVVDLGVEG